MEVGIPWRDSGDPYRARNHEFVIQWYRNHGFDVIIGDSRHLMFNRSAAKNACVNAMTDDVCIIADSDILFEDVNELLQSVDIAREENKLVMPIFELYWLNEKNSDEILAGQTIDKSIIKPELYLSGGIHIVPRNVHAIIGGYDEGYAGWGYEDMDYYIRHNYTSSCNA